LPGASRCAPTLEGASRCAPTSAGRVAAAGWGHSWFDKLTMRTQRKDLMVILRQAQDVEPRGPGNERCNVRRGSPSPGPSYHPLPHAGEGRMGARLLGE